MNILITGANGFLGKNLKFYLGFELQAKVNIYYFSRDDSLDDLRNNIKKSDFIFHFAGENRPDSVEDYYRCNERLTEKICDFCSELNPIPILYPSSTQANLNNDYGISKKRAEELIRSYSKKNKVASFVFRLPGIFGKWGRQNYNSVVATWCHNVMRGLPIKIDNRDKVIDLIYVDDVVDLFKNCLLNFQSANEFSFVEVEAKYTQTLGEIADLLIKFKQSRENLELAKAGSGFERALYSTFISYFPQDDFSYELRPFVDSRGSFFEAFKMADFGQVSVSTTLPGVTRGEHFHYTKTEKFLVLQGSGLIRFRNLNDESFVEYVVNAKSDKPRVVDIPPGYTHSITNTGNEVLILLMWANETYDKAKPDTYFLEV